MKKTFNLLTKKLFLLIVGVGAFSVLSASTFAAAPNGSLVLSGDANYAVNQAATLLGTTLTITDSGTEITAANDIHVKIPAGLNMEWDTSVTTVGITQSGNGVTSTTPTYVGTTGVTFDVTTNFDSGENVQITGLKVSSFTAGATADTLEWAVDNATYASGTFLAGTGDITVGAPTISATAQVFSVNQADTAMGAITIAEGTAIKINTDEDIRLTLPGATGVGLTWDDADVGVVCTDAGATTTPCLTHFGVISGAEITLTVDSYVANPAGGADKTLVIPVTADFDEVGDSVTFSGVNFEVGSVVVTDSIELEVAGANLGTISTATTGANVTIGGAPTFASAAAQTFYTGMSAQPVDWVMTITENATAPSINVTDDIRIVIPPTMYMQWDSSDASILVNGSDEDHITKAAGGACTADASDCTVTVTFSMADGSACTMASGAECKVMIIPVQAAFEIGDDITVTGALLAEFTQETTAAGLGLEIAGANYGTLRTATDSQTMEILVASSAAGNDKTGPVAPTAFAVSDQGVLTWTDPTDTDLKEIEVLKGVGNDPVNGTPVIIIAEGTETWTDPDVSVGDVVKYILRPVDTNNNPGTNTEMLTATIAEPPVPEPTATAEVTLAAVGESGQSGTATLTELDGTTTVVLALTGGTADVAQPAHIYGGTCGSEGEITYSLTDVTNTSSTDDEGVVTVTGASTTELEVTIAELKATEQYLNIHTSADDLTTILACGDLPYVAPPEEVVAPEDTIGAVTPDETGKVAEETTLQGEEEVSYATVQAETTFSTPATEEGGEATAYTGAFMPPTPLAEQPVVVPEEGKTAASEVVSIGSADTKITTDKPVTVYIKLSDSITLGNVFKINERTVDAETGEETLTEKGTCEVVASGDNYLAKCTLSSFSDFIILEEEPEEVVEEEEEEEEEEEVEVEVEDAPFVDTANHWAKDYVSDLYAKEIVSGKDETHYAPDDAVTRAEFTKIVVGAFDLDMVSTTGSFSDMSEHWSSKYVEAAKAAEVVGGYEDGTFKPDTEINRAEALKLLLEAAGVSLTADAADFPDVDGDIWYAKYVNYAAANEIVGGYSDGTFGPDRSITRGEVAKIVSLIIAE